MFFKVQCKTSQCVFIGSFSLCPQWKTEILDFCPSTRILLIGCKTDLRTDVCTLMELSNQKQTPITYEQVRQQRRHESVEPSLSQTPPSDVASCITNNLAGKPFLVLTQRKTEITEISQINQL